jgi:hypothetical protein
MMEIWGAETPVEDGEAVVPLVISLNDSDD